MQRLIDKDALIAFIKSNGYVYANTLETFPEVEVPEWISVDDGLPDEYEEEEDIFDPETLAVIDVERHKVSQLVIVAVTREDGERFASDDMTVDGKWVNYSRDYLAYDYKVTHWMPMPTPPKEETNET